MMTALRLVPLLLLAPTGGCAPIVGDDCQEQTDCGRIMYCEHSLPGGYCTQRGCTRNSCPAEGVCIEFETGTTYCMRACETDPDCRDGYRCVTDFGAHPFCDDELGASPE